MHWLLHLLGLDTQQSAAYNFWSGVATQASLVLGGAALYRRHNCHRRLCPRIGRHVIGGSPYCDRHHEQARRDG